MTSGYPFIVAGIDEAGRGPLAGPLAVAGVVLPLKTKITGLADSKKLTHSKRLLLAEEIKAKAIAYSIELVSVEEIDSLNILEATKLGMRRVANNIIHSSPFLEITRHHFLVDGNQKFCNKISNEPIIKGDDKILSISAASILAKTERDILMEKMARKYPAYEFENHKGYPTKLHKERIKEYGPCPIHRKTFRGVKEYANEVSAFTYQVNQPPQRP
ncbi:MAG TPA: ribonuclease HII [Oligoflexia bacterium]|nr:ribonuclease HII [Oligoflexia bacterium]HMP49719.1 ribonuclease HII [Oligoflexia bacterium]